MAYLTHSDVLSCVKVLHPTNSLSHAEMGPDKVSSIRLEKLKLMTSGLHFGFESGIWLLIAFSLLLQGKLLNYYTTEDFKTEACLSTYAFMENMFKKLYLITKCAHPN